MTANSCSLNDYCLKYSNSSKKFLKNLKDKKIAEIIFKGIEEIKKNPDNSKFLTDKYKCSRSKRKGKYRIIYRFYEDEKLIYILRIGHRDNIYD